MASFKERMAAKLAAAGGITRSDIELNQASVVEEGTAVRIVATYSNVYGTPNIHDIREWVEDRLGKFGNRVDLNAASLRAYPEADAPFFTAILQQRLERQMMSASERMVPAGPGQFLDASNQIWQVRTNSDGSEYLVREEETSIEDMLRARAEALTGGEVRTSRERRISADYNNSSNGAPLGGTATASVGDVVDFYHDGAIMRGVISAMTATGVKIKSLAGGETYTVDKAALIEVVERGAQDIKEQDDTVRAYWSQVYPANPEMVEEISPTSNLPIKGPTEAGGEKITPLEASAKRVSTVVKRPFHKTSK